MEKYNSYIEQDKPTLWNNCALGIKFDNIVDFEKILKNSIHFNSNFSIDMNFSFFLFEK